MTSIFSTDITVNMIGHRCVEILSMLHAHRYISISSRSLGNAIVNFKLQGKNHIVENDITTVGNKEMVSMDVCVFVASISYK